ncbi:MAG: hypothetical protein KIT84_07660 [Labilithrix sp.]|nr:hypothetical protein [Labilithrix sp.]MCW5810872.1 hypothetical protein [Labilithrix sp.]
MRDAVYGLCALTSLVCALLLLRAYRESKSQLLLWSTICFAGLFFNNVLLVVDELFTEDTVSLIIYRDASSLASVVALLVGLVWRNEGTR